MKKELLESVFDLTEKEIKELMYKLCRSGKVVIPQYYTETQLESMGCDADTLQERLEEDDELQDMIHNHIKYNYNI